ncbi:hypothetical protein [Vibrio palustris]|uniref:O-Antigen ligase n=1 Tax=Vibrio palustris TaxID=1918946 RepID=A0A1R4B3N4_9VIBR|nr:hypothetical protein [Vibrio palustris]SJL83515.1 hypothetical protein VPAL9027_01483 [Vibrio palustris]
MNNKHYTNFFLLLFFFPQFITFVGLAVEQIFTIMLFVFCSYYAVVKEGKVKILPMVVSFLFLLLLSISLLRSANSSTLGDIFELAKPFYFLSFYYFSYKFFKKNILTKETHENLIFDFLLSVIILVILVILEARVGIFNTIFHYLYKDLRGGVQFKAVGSFISPYTLGSFLILPFFINMFLVFFTNKKIKHFTIMILVLIGIISTQSRTTLLSLSLTLLCFLILSIFSLWIKGRKTSLIVIGSFVSLIVIFWSDIDDFFIHQYGYLYSGLKVVFDNFSLDDLDGLIYSTPSIGNRYDQMLEVIRLQSPLPLLGIMIGKDVVYPESFYAMYLLRVGLLGIILHFSMIIFGIVNSLKISKFYIKNQMKSLSAIYLGLSMYYISLGFSYFSSAVNDQTRTGFIFYASLGILSAIRYKHKNGVTV